LKTKEELLKMLGLVEEYNAHGGIVPDREDIVFFELIIDIRDILEELRHGPKTFLDQILNRK